MIIEFYVKPANKSFFDKQKPHLSLLPPTTPNPMIGGAYTYSQDEIAQAGRKHITVAEYCRRDRLIKAEYQACVYHTGDTVFPHSKTLYEKYGECVVIGICKTYADFGDAQWPANDNAFIVQVQPKKTVGRINATASYFQLEEPTT